MGVTREDAENEKNETHSVQRDEVPGIRDFYQ